MKLINKYSEIEKLLFKKKYWIEQSHQLKNVSKDYDKYEITIKITDKWNILIDYLEETYGSTLCGEELIIKAIMKLEKTIFN